MLLYNCILAGVDSEILTDGTESEGSNVRGYAGSNPDGVQLPCPAVTKEDIISKAYRKVDFIISFNDVCEFYFSCLL